MRTTYNEERLNKYEAFLKERAEEKRARLIAIIFLGLLAIVGVKLVIVSIIREIMFY